LLREEQKLAAGDDRGEVTVAGERRRNKIGMNVLVRASFLLFTEARRYSAPTSTPKSSAH
jgi:hypothetical protein